MKGIHVVIAAIAAITVLEIIALLKGIDGQLFATTIGAIAALVGYLFGAHKQGEPLSQARRAKRKRGEEI